MTRFTLILVVALALGACSLAGDVTPPPGLATAQALGIGLPPTAAPVTVPQRAPDTVAGKLIFAEKCAPCHGETGLGDGPQAGALPNPPTALANPQVAQRAIPEEWYRVVSEGRLDSFMPGFASLDDGQRWDVVGYALWLGLAADDVEAGRQLYGQACAACHGDDGQGIGDASALASPDFQASSSLLAILSVLADGQGQGMPAFADSMSETERRSVAAFVRSLGLPSGPPTTVEATVTTLAPATLMPTPPSVEGQGTPGTEPTALPSPTAGAALATVAGKVRNGTNGAGTPAGLEITLHGFDGNTEASTSSAKAGVDGSFIFEGVAPAAGRTYVATTDYQGVLYASEISELPADSSTLDLPLTVYEATSETGAVQIGRLHLLFDFPADGVVQVVELWLLSNLGDRTVFAADQGRIEVTLPEGASGLSLDGGTVGDRFELTPTGFRDRRELIPGENTSELVFSYNLPYDGSLEMVRQVPYPVAATVAMVTGDGPTITGEGFTDMGQREISGASLHTYQRGPALAGERIAVELSGQPGSATTSTTAQRTTILFGVAALALALVGAGLIWFRPRRRPAAAAEPPEAPTDEEAALWAIASLDNDFAAGKIDPATYQARRADLVRRAQDAAARD